MVDPSIRSRPGPRSGVLNRNVGWPRFGPLILLPMVLSGCRIEIEPEQDVSLETYAARSLDESADAWNRGDLEAFLSDYLNAPSTTFVGSRGVLSGMEQIRQHYAPYFRPGAQRDSLRFESLRVRSLSPMIGLVTARWVLYGDGVTRSAGPVTLVVRRTGSGWRTIHDHSSSDPAPDGL